LRETNADIVPAMVTDIGGLKDHVGEHLGWTDWREISQERVNQFAEATDDHQWIHVDPERAASGPFGQTIAHGYLTLSLVAPMMFELLQVEGVSMGINYGLDRVRFPAPVPVGSRIRAGAELAEVTDVAGGVQSKVVVTFEVENGDKPACVAEVLVRHYG
jgi:acyl dehydratase